MKHFYSGKPSYFLQSLSTLHAQQTIFDQTFETLEEGANVLKT